MEGDYIKGKPDGTWLSWYDDGVLAYEKCFRLAVRHGNWVEYFQTGDIERKGQYLDGEKEGLWLEWSDTAAALLEIEYEHGKTIRHLGKQ